MSSYSRQIALCIAVSIFSFTPASSVFAFQDNSGTSEESNTQTPVSNTQDVAPTATPAPDIPANAAPVEAPAPNIESAAPVQNTTSDNSISTTASKSSDGLDWFQTILILIYTIALIGIIVETVRSKPNKKYYYYLKKGKYRIWIWLGILVFYGWSLGRIDGTNGAPPPASEADMHQFQCDEHRKAMEECATATFFNRCMEIKDRFGKDATGCGD